MKKYSKVLSSRELTKAAINAKKEVSFVAFYNHCFYLIFIFKTWASFEEDFNSNCKGVHRSIIALKNKSKNLRANTRKGTLESEHIYNVESETEDEEIESLEYEESEFLNEQDFHEDNTITIEEITPETVNTFTTSLIQEIDIIPTNNTTSQVIYKDDLKEIERENLLLKNEVLKKKKRLLELEIAIAEKKLRGQ